MQKGIRIAVLGLLLTVPAFGQEELSLDTPAPVATVGVPVGFQIQELNQRRWPPSAARVEVTLVALISNTQCATDSRGKCQTLTAIYTGAEAIQIINTIDSADLRANSLPKRILNRLRQDGRVPAGSVTGTGGIPTPEVPPGP